MLFVVHIVNHPFQWKGVKASWINIQSSENKILSGMNIRCLQFTQSPSTPANGQGTLQEVAGLYISKAIADIAG